MMKIRAKMKRVQERRAPVERELLVEGMGKEERRGCEKKRVSMRFGLVEGGGRRRGCVP